MRQYYIITELEITKIGYRQEIKKAVPLQTWAGPEGSRRLTLPDF
jgi:hypothetical protein